MKALDLGSHEPRRKTHVGKSKSPRAFIKLLDSCVAQLQKEAAASGMTALLNPVPKVLSWNRETDPDGLTRDWAQLLDREFRSTLTNPPHGRADIAKALRTDLTFVDPGQE